MKWVLIVMLLEVNQGTTGTNVSNTVSFQEWDDPRACLAAKADIEKVLKAYFEKFDEQYIFCKPKGVL